MTNERTQAIAGVVPPDVAEAVVMQVWPSISASAPGRLLGNLYQVPFLLRVPIVLVTLPLVILLYALPQHRLVRYTLTTRRILIQKGIRPQPRQDLALDELDEVRVSVRPGQGFFRAGDLELIKEGQVALLLPGVQCPETFRRNILATRDAYKRVMQVQRAKQEEKPSAA
jgi:hypothetical protein